MEMSDIDTDYVEFIKERCSTRTVFEYASD